MNWFMISVSYLFIVWCAAFPAACECVYHHPENSRHTVLIWAALPLLLIVIPASLPGYALLWICDKFLHMAVMISKQILRGWLEIGRPLLRVTDLMTR